MVNLADIPGVGRAVPHLCQMKPKHLPEVLAIEEASFPDDDRWQEDNFRNILQRRDYIGLVAELGEQVVGYVVFQMKSTAILIRNIATHPNHRRVWIGSTMLDRLKSRLIGRRQLIAALVYESNLPTHLFLKANWFLARGIVRRPTPFEDSYQFVYDNRPVDRSCLVPPAC